MTELAKRETLTIPLSGRAEWFENHVHEMSPAVLNRYLAEFTAKRNLTPCPFSVEERLEIELVVHTLENRLDHITPNLPADVNAHDRSVSDRVLERWPIERTKASRDIHHHFCELIFAWNMNPFKDEVGVASVDEFAENFGMSRFAFVSKRDADAWLESYGLDDFVVRCDDTSGEFYYVTLSNQFVTSEVNEFLAVYNAAMTSITLLQAERKRAIINDGGRVGFACIDHFAAREVHELLRIKAARENLGAGFKELNK